MKVVILNCFETYNNRIMLIYNSLKELNYDVKIIQSNFSHMSKMKVQHEQDDLILVETKPYKRNLSLERLISHSYFAKEAISIAELESPDIIYCVLPPNSLAKEVVKYKKRHLKTKILFDIIDLWPETYPIKHLNNNFFFRYWRNLRDKSLMKADKIITECNYYQDILSFKEKKIKATTLYMSRPNKNIQLQPIYNKDQIHICYLGSVNNLIDINLIKDIIQTIQMVKPVVLHIIGAGENLNRFIDTIESINAKVIYHGIIYNAADKQKVFNICHFGINVMKPSVVVGLTMKSVDYFEAGLPIINSIPGDTKEFVNRYKVGINYSSDKKNELINTISNYNADIFHQNHQNARELYELELSEEVFKKKFENVLEEIH